MTTLQKAPSVVLDEMLLGNCRVGTKAGQLPDDLILEES
jgi:hypothetical protein